MGMLRKRGSNLEVQLRTDTLVGRSRRCDLVLSHDSVSQTHASLRFLAGMWHVEDRNSKNGTWIDGVCLSRSAEGLLVKGSVVRFGAKGMEEWELIDDSPPLGATAGLLTAPVSRSLSQARMVIRSNLEVQLTAGMTEQMLRARMPYLVLQALARERLTDRAHGRSPEDEGWIDRHSLAERLRHRDINQDIHRIRQEFQGLALFDDAGLIITDLRDQGKVRVGVYDVHVD